jgi:hypothetical protein
LDYAEFNKDNPFQLNEHSFNKIRKYIEFVEPIPRKLYRRKFNRKTRTYPVLDNAAKALHGCRVTSVDVSEYFTVQQRPSNASIGHLMNGDCRFQSGEYETSFIHGRDREFKTFLVVG